VALVVTPAQMLDGIAGMACAVNLDFGAAFGQRIQERLQLRFAATAGNRVVDDENLHGIPAETGKRPAAAGGRAQSSDGKPAVIDRKRQRDRRLRRAPVSSRST